MKILIVEDNADQQLLIQRVCQDFFDHCDIETARDGTLALELLERKSFDAIVLDYSLPKMNGLDVLSLIHTQTPGTPVIMVTGQGAESIAVEAMKRGAYDYIIKSGSYFETIPRIIQKAIEKSQLNRKLEKAGHRLKRLQELSLSITTERNIEVLSNLLVKGVCDLIECEGSILFLIDAETASIHYAATFGVDMAWAAYQSRVESIGILGASFIDRKSILSDQLRNLPFWDQTPEIKPLPRNLISVPLIQEGKVGGVLIGLNRTNGDGFGQEDLDALLTLTINAGVAIDNARFIQEKEKQAVTDSLTGLNNRLEFQKRFSVEYERSLRNRNPFSLLMIDIDHFKKVNDTFGHPAGDAVLVETVKRIQSCIRNFDFMARYGGEEFVVLLPETDGEQARLAADRILKSVNSAEFHFPGGVRQKLSVSIGIASHPVDPGGADELIKAADEALYYCKKNGRNRICQYQRIINMSEN